MADSKKVSDLNVDVSIRWAKDQELLQETRPIITEAGAIPAHTQKDVTLPSTISLTKQLFGMDLIHRTWASFLPPEGYNVQFRRLFTSAIAPSIGNDEQCADKAAKLETIDSLSSDEQEQRKTFMGLLALLEKLNKDLIFALTRLSQYQKG